MLLNGKFIEGQPMSKKEFERYKNDYLHLHVHGHIDYDSDFSTEYYIFVFTGKTVIVELHSDADGKHTVITRHSIGGIINA